MIVDYHSRYFDASQPKFKTTAAVVNSMKATINCHWIPVNMNSDNVRSSIFFRKNLVCFVSNTEHSKSCSHFQPCISAARMYIVLVIPFTLTILYHFTLYYLIYSCTFPKRLCCSVTSLQIILSAQYLMAFLHNSYCTISDCQITLSKRKLVVRSTFNDSFAW